MLFKQTNINSILKNWDGSSEEKQKSIAKSMGNYFKSRAMYDNQHKVDNFGKYVWDFEACSLYEN